MIRNITKSDAQISINQRSMLLSSPVFGAVVVALPEVVAAFVGVFVGVTVGVAGFAFMVKVDVASAPSSN